MIMQCTIFPVAVLVASLTFCTTLRAQDNRSFPEPQLPFAPRQYVCYRTDAPLAIDGRLDEPAWQKAAWTEGFVDIEGTLKPKPRFRTRAKMLWSARYFYVAAELEEPHIWATLKQRDAVIFHDNDFEVFIDPDGDTHQYYELEINAFGTEWDLFLVKPYRDGGPALNAWDIQGLQTAVRIDGTLNQPGDVDRRWLVEIAMPWRVLKECAPRGQPPRPGDQWRVNFSRVEWQVQVVDGRYRKKINPETGKPFPEDNWVWSPQGLVNMHYPEMWGFVQFSGQPVGRGQDAFVFRKSEWAKWALRQVYYKEKTFFTRHGRYTVAIDSLGLQNPGIDGISWPPQIRCTWSGFEARLRVQGSDRMWRIDEEGKAVGSNQ